jgi:hypothetical protein
MAFTEQTKSGQNISEQNLLIEGAYELLIDATYSLNIQDASSGVQWSTQTKN